MAGEERGEAWQQQLQGANARTLRIAQVLLKAAAPALVATPGEDVSEATWLAEQADRSPVPAGWCRCYDQLGRELFVHENGAFPVQWTHPMLGYFASLLSMVIAAKAGEMLGKQLRQELEMAKDRIAKEAQAIAAAWAGPWRVGPEQWEMWHCEASGWHSTTDPLAAPRHLLEVFDSLEDMLGHLLETSAYPAEKAPKVPKETDMAVSPVARAVSGKLEGFSAKRTPDTAASTATPSTISTLSLNKVTSQIGEDDFSGLTERGCSEMFHSPMDSPREDAGDGNANESCSWFVIASPRSDQSKGSPNPDATGQELAWYEPAASGDQSERCVYFAMSPGSVPSKPEALLPHNELLDAEESEEVQTPSYRISIFDASPADSYQVRPQRLDFTPGTEASPYEQGVAFSSEVASGSEETAATDVVRLRSVEALEASDELNSGPNENSQFYGSERLRAAGFSVDLSARAATRASAGA